MTLLSHGRSLFEAFFHGLFARRCAVMPAAEQLVPRHVEIAVVAFKITMMDLVVEVPEMQALFVAEEHALKTCVRGDCQKAIEHQVEDDMDGVACYGEMGEHGAEVEEMLNGVHRQAGPRADVCVAVVQGVEAVH